MYTNNVLVEQEGSGKHQTRRIQRLEMVLPSPLFSSRKATMRTSAKTNQENHAAPTDVEAITNALAEPFDPTEVRFKPAVVSGNRSLALAYVDARVVQNR